MTNQRRDAIIGCGGLLGVLSILLLMVVLLTPDEEPPKPPPDPKIAEALEYLDNAQQAFDDDDFRAARKLADTALTLNPDLTDAALLAGNSAIEFKDLELALEYFQRVPKRKQMTPWRLQAEIGIARAQFLLGSHAIAEKQIRSALIDAPDDFTANDLLAELLDVHGRRWDSVPYAIEVARQGRASLEALLLLADGEFIINPNNRAKRATERFEHEHGALLGLARAAFGEGSVDDGLRFLERACESPDQLEAKLIRVEYALNHDRSDFGKLHAALPEQATTYPRLWFIRGLFAQRNEQTESSARCFWEVLKRNPNHRGAHFRLAQTLQALGRDEDAKPFLDRGLLLSQLKKLLEPVIAAGSDSNEEEIVDIIVTLEALGRNIEARAWEAWLDRTAGDKAEFVSVADAVPISERLSQWVSPDSRLAESLDLADYPLPTIAADKKAANADAGSTFMARFEDQAEQAGIDFTFIAAPDEQTDGKRIIELTGGGVAAIDFDLDTWPDILFTQGGYVPAVQSAHAPRDRLFRNEVDGYADVTKHSGLGSADYGQGMAVGDFNADGFPDMFVGNLGTNRLFANNGDGTFVDVTTNLDDEHTDWTTSCVFADFNNDSLPDLYVTNYLSGEELTTRICRLVENAKPRMCTPDQFPAAQDRVFLNRGDGSFEDRTEQSGIELPQGKGLGVLAADFDFSGAIQLFVANDGVPNFFYDIHPTSFTFTNVATTVGLALNGDGLAQACMGVAAGDVNSDGRPDLFVTNFDREPNTLYLNSAGLFEDVTRPAGLFDPSFRMLGFGTQFIDGNLDGNLDLIVTNGHVDDFSHQRTPYRMRPQYFIGGNESRFREAAPDEAGSFFSRPQLGRGMCRIDWNRDGREDVVISHLDTPAALLTNTADRTGNSIAVRLVGTNMDRDATGAMVRVSDGDWQCTRQVVAGDGYMSCNERRLILGVGNREQVSKLEVRWLDGSVQSLEAVEASSELLIVQGVETSLRIPR